MIALTDATGLLGNALAMSAACLLLPGCKRLPRRLAIGMVALAFLLALVPAAGLPLAAYLRGAVGDLSITTQLLLFAAISRSLFGWQPLPGRQQLLLLVAVAALVLYPMALGAGGFDPYRLGYGSPWFISALLALVLLAVGLGLHAIVLAMALSVSAWAAGWMESTNLWDYLLDPLLALYAAGSSIRHYWRRRRRQG